MTTFERAEALNAIALHLTSIYWMAKDERLWELRNKVYEMYEETIEEMRKEEEKAK